MTELTRSQLEILIVEPSDTQGKIITRALQKAGVEYICQVCSGGQALEEIQLAMPDVMVSALHLPDMTASELVQQVHALPAPERVAFVLISSETRLRYLDPIRQAGAVAVLGKPFAAEELDLALDAALDLVDRARLTVEDGQLHRYNVLIVDDMELARKHIRRVLTAMGFQHFSEAINGRAAMETLGTQRFDLIVTDYNMPEMDGCELVQAIRERHATIPILMITGENDNSRLSAVEQAGVSAICDKPFAPAYVKTLVQRMLQAA
ncbi:MAG: response regulator [Gammaproteobacteria bacterium]|nr:response regulator [Gammaproteobacteria bacterium]